MKNKYGIIACILAIFSLTSCFKDLGNYDYSENEVITITNIQSSYTAIQLLDKLNITPTVTSNRPDAEFEYYYTLYETNVQGYAPTLDTIQTNSKDLVNYLVNKRAMNYGLVFMAKNKKTGVTGFFKSTLSVVTKFNNGWYVLKSEGDVTDLDLFDLNNNKIENVLLGVNGVQLQGKAQCLTVASNYKVFNSVTGRFGNAITLFPVSTRDAKAVLLTSAKIEHNFEEMFYDPINKPYEPGMFMANSMGLWTTNQGRSHALYAMSSNSGKFGVEFPINPQYSNYRLSKYSAFEGLYGPISFDEISSSFVIVPPQGSQLIEVKDQALTEMKTKNNNKTLLYMGCRAVYDTCFYAVMKDKTNPNIRMISRISGFDDMSEVALRITNDTLSVSDLAFNASTYTSNHGLDILYFVAGNKIYMRNVAAKRTANIALAIPIQDGESVNFIKHIPKDRFTSFNYFVVGTSSGGNYKVRMFTVKSTGDVESVPALTLEGKGTAADVLYAFPTINSTTFPSSY